MSDAPKTRSADKERAYLEDLLNRRFSYYLLFMSVLLLPITGANPLSDMARAGLLLLGAFVSVFIAMMVIRTRLLLGEVLNEILSDRRRHPYKRAFENVRRNRPFFSKNANTLMCWLSAGLTVFFLAAGIIAAIKPEILFDHSTERQKVQIEIAPTAR